MKNRLKLFNLIIAMLFIIGNSFSVMGAENEEIGTWETKESMITPRTEFGLAEVNGKIYVVGGKTGGKYYSLVEEYDPLTNTWSQKADMPTARTHFAIIEVNDKIYAIGGLGANQVFLNTVEEYNPSTDTWITKASMPTPRDYFTIAQAHGKIYVVGGRKSDLSRTNIVEEYDPVTDTWTTKANIPIKLSNAAAEQVNGKIYVIGGLANGYLKNVQVYDPLTDTWTAKSNMPIGRCSLDLAKVNGKIYAIGGNSKEEAYLNKVEEYDTVTDTWTTKANMPTGRKGLGAIGINNKVYAIGGQNGHDYLNTLEVFNPFGTELTKPSTPLNLKAIPESKNIVLYWDQVEDVEKYIIKRATRKEGPYEIIGDNTTETTYIDKDVELGVTYYYIVRAVKDGVESEDSNIASAMVEENTNVAVLQLKLTTTDIYEYRLTMTDVNDFMDWYIGRVDGTGLPFYKFIDNSSIEPYTDANEYIIFDKIVWFKVKEYLQ